MLNNSNQAILGRFHALIRSIAGKLVDNKSLVMPQLPESIGEKCYFPVPGMHGGFSFWFETLGGDQKLVVTSWNRIVEDSEQTFEITVDQTIRQCEGT